ncbi:MAG: AsmA-like C-terminal region-containing protein, partial [Candidatus Latescibacterota bacterium]
YQLRGRIDMNLVIVGIRAPGPPANVRGSMKFTGVSIQPPRAAKPMKNMDGEAVFTLAGREILVDSLLLNGLGGAVRAKGRIDLAKKPAQFAFDSKVRNVDLAELISLTPAGSRKRAEGKVNLDLLFGGQGTKWADMQHSIDGQGSLSILQGVITDVNIIQALLGELGEQLGSSNFISEQMRSAYPHVFTANKTVFKSIEGIIRIEKGTIIAPNLNLGTEDYRLAGSGSIRLDRMVESKATLILSQRLSKDVMQQVSLASMLADDKGQVQLPFTISGILPKAVVKPDLSGKIKAPPIAPEVDKLKKKLLDRLFPAKKKQ